ncbi:hypothetical protein ACLB2K_047455 [Fragaria x ananassa]
MYSGFSFLMSKQEGHLSFLIHGLVLHVGKFSASLQRIWFLSYVSKYRRVASSWSLTAKEQLISLITSVASTDSSLRKRIRRAADAGISHRKIFVHELGWDTTREVFVFVFVFAFEPFGEVEDSNLIMDKLTGKAKGNGFVLFKTRRAALKALRDPKKTIGSRCASC